MTARPGLLALAAGAVVVVVVAVTLGVVVLDGDDTSRGNQTARPGPVVSGNAPEPGDPAPPFVLPRLDGHGKVDLRALRGRPVIVNFWASWCHPCRQEFPLLRAARRAHREDRLEIVGVTYRDIPSDARRFARAQRASWALVVDEDGDVARAYGVRAIPQTFFVRADGTVAARSFGITTREDLEADLAKIL